MTQAMILVSSVLDSTKQDGSPSSEISRPRLDYLEISHQINAMLLGYSPSNTRFNQKLRQLEKRLKLDVVEAITAGRRASQYDVVLSLSEKVAIPLAVLFLPTREKIPHIVIGHKLSTGLKTYMFRLWRLQDMFAHVICLCQAQADYAIHQLGISPAKVHFVYDKVDHRFFSPANRDNGGYILSVGQEQRDYETLLQAVSNTDIQLIVVASSPWSTSQVQMHSMDESRVKVLSRIPYTQLRDLYAGARLVVTPLHNVDYAAGVNAVLEGMAMARPMVVTRTQGIADYIHDGETGCFVEPGNAAQLRETFRWLWDNPVERQRLGTNARTMVEEKLNLDHYVDQIVKIVRSVTNGSI